MLTFSAHLGYLFTELPLEERFAAARQAGFSTVEHPSPYALSADHAAALCWEHGLGFAQMALPAGDPSRGEKGIACLPGREEDFEASVRHGLAYARRVGSRYIHVMSGVLPAGLTREDAWLLYISNLRAACQAASEVGIPSLIEPIGKGTIANYLMDHPDLAVRAIEEIGSPNLFMLFDTFHAANSGIDPVAYMRKHHHLIAHVHIADHPGRHEPGTGNIDFAAFFAVLEDVGFAGAIGLEYIPAGATVAGLAWRNDFPWFQADRPREVASRS
jgi:hydroxypyruvate isomerase